MAAQPTDAAGRPGRSAPEVKAPAAGRAFSKDTRQGTDSGIIAEARPVRGELPALQRNQWARVTLTDGSTQTFRIVRRGLWGGSRPRRVWYVDCGGYGPSRDDFYIEESLIVSAVPAQRPTLLLTFTDPFGRVRRVGRYATRAEAEAAALKHRYVTDVRIEDVRRGGKHGRSDAAQAVLLTEGGAQ